MSNKDISKFEMLRVTVIGVCLFAFAVYGVQCAIDDKKDADSKDCCYACAVCSKDIK